MHVQYTSLLFEELATSVRVHYVVNWTAEWNMVRFESSRFWVIRGTCTYMYRKLK